MKRTALLTCISLASLISNGVIASEAAIPDPLPKYADNEYCEVLRTGKGDIKKAEKNLSQEGFRPGEIRLIKQGRITYHMREEAMLCSWGSPLRVSQTLSRHGIQKHYLFEDYFLYTLNGRVDLVGARLKD